MTNNYYCLIAGLPEISFNDTKIKLNIDEFRTELKADLNEEDYRLIEIFYYKYDNQNILNILLKKETKFISSGIFKEQDIEEEIKRIKEEGISSNSIFPDYIQQLIFNFQNDQLKKDLSIENELSLLYFNYAINCGNVFIREYYMLELNLLNFLTASFSRKYNIEYDNEILGDDDISQQIRKSNAKDFNLSGEFEITNQLVQIVDNEDIMDRESKIDLLRWKKSDEMTFFHYFTVERIFAYLVKLEIVNRWIGLLDNDKGKKEFDDILNRLKTEYEIPNEYLIK